VLFLIEHLLVRVRIAELSSIGTLMLVLYHSKDNIHQEECPDEHQKEKVNNTTPRKGGSHKSQYLSPSFQGSHNEHLQKRVEDVIKISSSKVRIRHGFSADKIRRAIIVTTVKFVRVDDTIILNSSSMLYFANALFLEQPHEELQPTNPEDEKHKQHYRETITEHRHCRKQA
jgi:hypothetical protein